MVAFTLSAFIAGVAGCLIAYRFGSVSSTSFGVVASLTALAFAYLGGLGGVSGAVAAGLLAPSGVVFFGLGELTGSVGAWETFIGGLLLIVMAIKNPEGVAGALRIKAEAWRARRAATTGPGAAGGPGASGGSGSVPVVAGDAIGVVP
jgi:branched-chain amino acid transport system permease protein